MENLTQSSRVASTSLSYTYFDCLLLAIIAGVVYFKQFPMEKHIPPITSVSNTQENDIEETSESLVEPDVIDCTPAPVPPYAENPKPQISESDNHHHHPLPVPVNPSPPSTPPTPGRTPFRRPTKSPHLPNFSSLLGIGPTTPSPMAHLDISLHSPSSHIVGTPFATNSTRFEYPFPDTSSSSPSGSLSSGSPRLSPDLPPVAIALTTHPVQAPGASLPIPSVGLSSSVAAYAASSPAQPFVPLPPIPSSSPFPLEPAGGIGGSTASTSQTSSPSLPFNFTHLKLKTAPNPPIPPSLASKRHRWSLSLLAKRKNSVGSQPLPSPGSTRSSTSGSLDTGYTPSASGSPLGSPGEDPASMAPTRLP